VNVELLADTKVDGFRVKTTTYTSGVKTDDDIERESHHDLYLDAMASFSEYVAYYVMDGYIPKSRHRWKFNHQGQVVNVR
jgi:hypothetical protein